MKNIVTDYVLKQAAHQVAQWQERQRKNKTEPNADQVWHYICDHYSEMTLNNREWIFQHCDPRTKKQRA